MQSAMQSAIRLGRAQDVWRGKQRLPGVDVVELIRTRLLAVRVCAAQPERQVHACGG